MGAMAWTHEFLAWVFIVALAQFVIRRWLRRWHDG